ncbi:MAG: type II toxin-antitoxin system VapC family toxin [Steroidobacteraceae bacterium]
MIGLDTNVLVRYIMQDDIKQSPLATRIVESLTAESPGYVPLVAIVELDWVLSSAYGLSRSQLIQAFEALLRTKEIAVERGETVWKGLRLLQRSGGDFADCLIACSAEAAGCVKTMTFDRGAAKSGGMTLV